MGFYPKHWPSFGRIKCVPNLAFFFVPLRGSELLKELLFLPLKGRVVSPNSIAGTAEAVPSKL